jgi:hypothetical protein
MTCGNDESTTITAVCINEIWRNRGCSGTWALIPSTSSMYQSGRTSYNQVGTTNVIDVTNQTVGGLKVLMAAYAKNNPSSCNNASQNMTTNNNISDILFNIQNLQTTEQDLIKQLDTYTSSSGYVSSDPKILDYIKNINTIADARIAMFNLISTNATILQTGVSQSRIDLVSQMTLLQAVETQLNDAKTKIDELNNSNDTKMRLVEINTYYGQRYEAQSNLMKKIIFFCLPVLILFILKKKELLPENIANVLIGVVIAVGAFMIMRATWDIFTRSNMDFEQYEWEYEFADTTRPPTIWEYNKTHFFMKFFDITTLLKNLMANLGICVGDDCCSPGQTYDSNKLKCVNKKMDGFTSGKGLKGTVVASYMNDEYAGIAPFSYEMEYATL